MNIEHYELKSAASINVPEHLHFSSHPDEPPAHHPLAESAAAHEQPSGRGSAW